MTITTKRELTCDHIISAGVLAGARCAVALCLDDMKDSAIRTFAHKKGWGINATGDYCPAHAKGKQRSR